MKKFAKVAAGAACAWAAVTASAAWVTEQDAFSAAKAFVGNDAVGSAVLSGCEVAAVSQRGNVWVASLSPSGHVLLSRSDIADPIVGFSQNNFSEPDPDSPAYAYLAGIDASLATLESNGGTRHERWNRLLAGRTRNLLKAGPVENPDTVIIPPFLESHYNQDQPYNDYAPVYNAATNITSYPSYRGRCPCGCVATAAAQGFRHFRWPVRMDRVDSFDHTFTDTNSVTTSFPLRFDGHVPMDWAALEDSYINYTSFCVTNYYTSYYTWGWEYSYDLRGTVSESVRHPIARLVLFADVLAHMSFTSGGSSASYDTVADNASEWYVKGKWVDMVEGAEQIRNDIAFGVPCHVSIGAYNENNVRYKGHEVLAHGWAESGSVQYIYINFGWGGSNDGYYNLADDIQDYQEKEVYVGHYPRAKPQIDPLPKVCGTDVTLNWHFPDFYTNNLSGFSVSISKTATTTSTFLDDFSASSGVSDIENGSINSGQYDKMYIGTDTTYGSDCGQLLYVEPLAVGHFTYADKLTLTAYSKVSFKLRSVNANGSVFEIQVRFNDGDWKTVYAPTLSTSSGYNADSGWQTCQIDLSDHAGETALFRINKDFEWGSYYPSGRILVDDFTVSNVLRQEEPSTVSVAADGRSCEIANLEDGRAYSFAVTPTMDTTALVAGEKSDAVSATIDSTRALGMPQIVSVSSVSEGFYRECGLEATTFDVTCSESVTNLTARPSHLALVSDEDVTVTPNGNGRFTVTVRPSGVTEDNARSRMILTLAATDFNGTTAYKDLSLRFAPIESVAAVKVEATTSSGTAFSVDVPYEWIESNGLVSAGSTASASEYEAALSLSADFDGDGIPNWAEYVCGTSPTNSASKLTATIRMENGTPVVEYEPNNGFANGFKAVIKGTDNLADDFSKWEIKTETNSFHFFRVEIVPE